MDIFNKKKSIPMIDAQNPVYFNIPLSITYLSAVETIICYTDIEINRVYILRSTSLSDFQNTEMNS